MDYYNKFRNYSIEELEQLAIKMFKGKAFDNEEISTILDIRKGKLNAAFEWTFENKKRFLCLNDKIWNCFEKLKVESTALHKSLQDRVEAKDDFLHDFEIEAVVTPFFYEEVDGERCEKDHGIEEVLMMYWKEHLLRSLDSDDKNVIFGLGEDVNYNDYSFYREHFINDFVSQPMHYLWDLSNWSRQDFLKINHLWAELEVKYQHFMDV